MDSVTAVAFAEFYAANVRGLTLQLYAYLGDQAEAQDLVQEAFTRAFVRWKKLGKYDQPGAWVRRVAWNLAINRIRGKRRAAVFVSKQRPEVADGPDPDRVALIVALRTLPPQQRRAVVMHHMAQLSVAEIAEQEQVAVGTVKSWLSRGRTALAAQLADQRKGN